MESGHIAENLFERVNDGYGQLTVSDEGGGNGFHQIDPQPGTFFTAKVGRGAGRWMSPGWEGGGFAWQGPIGGGVHLKMHLFSANERSIRTRRHAESQ